MPELDYVSNYLKKYNIPITGIIHIGAHKFEELPCYLQAGISIENIIWIEANKKLIESQNNSNLLIYNYCISDEEDKEVEFQISNSTACSSILDFDIHSKNYPDITFIESIKLKTETISSFYKKEKFSHNFANYLHLDIQGSELQALKGAGILLNNFDYINTEVNLLHMYKDCPLLDDIDVFLREYDFIRIETNFGPGSNKTIDGKWPGIRDYTIDGWGDALYIKKSKLTSKNIGENRH